MIDVVSKLISEHGPVVGLLIMAIAVGVMFYRKNDKRIEADNARLIERVEILDATVSKLRHTVSYLVSLINFADLTPDERARAEREIMDD